MNSPLPPDPYKALGVAKDAKLPEIRSAHRKLVLKCHPDKVQDAALKAIKQDEFQQVQQAYEILSDDSKRQQYDDQVKLYELRREMGRGNPTPRSNPFEYEVKTAEPRANSYARAAPKVYTYPTSVPRSNEDLYDEPLRHAPKKSTSYESAADRERKRPSRDDERAAREATIRRYQEEERVRQEKARDKEKRERAHTEKKKSRDKERKSRTDEKTRTRQTYVEDDSSDEDVYRAARAAEKKAARRIEEEIRMRNEQAAAMRAADAARAEHARDPERTTIKEAPMDPKWSDHRDFAGAYMQAARRKGAVEPEDDRHHPHPGMRRAETFAGASPQFVRYASSPPEGYSDDDTPRRSSGYKDQRRTSDTPSSSKREKSRRRSPEHPTRDPYINIVEPPSPSPTGPKKPSLQTYNSAPPTLPRKEPSRARTQDYPRKDTIPPLPRAQTFTGDTRDRGRDRGGSRLRKEYPSAESDSDSPHYSSPRPSHSPPHRTSEPTVYRVAADGRSHPIPPRNHRSDLHNLNESSYPRERSQSPRGTPSRHERPPLTRNPPSGEYRTAPNAYYAAPEPPPTKPIVVTARPKLPREGSRSHKTPNAASYDQVKYAPTYDKSQVHYANYPGASLYDTARRPSDQREYYGPHPRSRGDPVYA
ncbi:hypothetical protein EG329_013484 [Mollisiaceae sp. DMI_Dod_QoI]|nr:hypothetical protein EG329_013484 [Helotiales sp. DMI_Dod_QoI]